MYGVRLAALGASRLHAQLVRFENGDVNEVRVNFVEARTLIEEYSLIVGSDSKNESIVDVRMKCRSGQFARRQPFSIVLVE
jgi:hypothetical protein